VRETLGKIAFDRRDLGNPPVRLPSKIREEETPVSETRLQARLECHDAHARSPITMPSSPLELGR
jgi:hypothetical protein